MKFTSSELAVLPSMFEGREGIAFSPAYVARVRVFGVRANDQEILGQYQALETPGLNSARDATDFSAPVSKLCATRTFLAGHHNAVRFFFDPVVVARVLAIVSVLAPGLTYKDDYIKGPPMQTRNGRTTWIPMNCGPCTSKLMAYLHRQTLIEDPDNAEMLAHVLKKESSEGIAPP